MGHFTVMDYEICLNSLFFKYFHHSKVPQFFPCLIHYVRKNNVFKNQFSSPYSVRLIIVTFLINPSFSMLHRLCKNTYILAQTKLLNMMFRDLVYFAAMAWPDNHLVAAYLGGMKRTKIAMMFVTWCEVAAAAEPLVFYSFSSII